MSDDVIQNVTSDVNQYCDENATNRILLEEIMKPSETKSSHPTQLDARSRHRTALKWLLGSILLCGAVLLMAPSAHAQVTVKVDSTKTWGSWLNVLDTSNGYLWGQGWAAADLRAGFIPNQASATRIVLRVNTNTYNPADIYWNNPDGSPNKHLEANFYVEEVSALGGNEVTFSGMVESNSIPAGWSCQAVIKEFGSGYAWIGLSSDPLVGGSPFSVTRSIGGGNIVQYGFMIVGPNAAPDSAAALAGISVLVDNSDPAITVQPSDQRTILGGTASFNVTATGSSAVSYQWRRYGTNLVNGGNISGATSPTLTIVNAQAADATIYTVGVTNLAGGLLSAPARLRALTPAEFANSLDNPSFELDVVSPMQVPGPWFNFTGSQLQNTNDLYFWTPGEHVQTRSGTNVVQIYNAGEWNGIYQDVPAMPGDIFVGDMWLWQSSFDPLYAPINEAFLEVQFRAGGANPIATYASIYVTNGPTMLDNWLFLQATNGVAAGYSQTTTTNSYYLVAPPGTEFVRFQLTLHAVGAGAGSVYVDDARLMKKIPVAVTSRADGANVELSWLTQGATDYQVVYTDDLAAGTWIPIGSLVAGDGSIKSVSFPANNDQRFYRVLTK
jgi:hypothetical protein